MASIVDKLSPETTGKLEALGTVLEEKAAAQSEAAETIAALREGLQSLLDLPAKIAMLDEQFRGQALDAVKSIAADLGKLATPATPPA